MQNHCSTKVLTTCPLCGIAFEMWSYESRDGRKHCSPKCGNASRRQASEGRFWKYVDKDSSPHGCWLWTGGTKGNGYGAFQAIRGQNGLAHRYSWELHNGAIPEGLLICHGCDKHYIVGDDTYKRCVNPAHLFLGTPAQNSADMKAKGRAAYGDRNGARKYPERYTAFLRPDLPRARGERNTKAKLTEGQVRDIRARYAQGASQRTLAIAYGVSKHTIQTIVRRQTWKHVA